VILLTAPLPVLAERHIRRKRSLEIAAADDLALLQELLDDWLQRRMNAPLLSIDASADDPAFSETLPRLMAAIRPLLNG
jgi:deoxyadenosine/deoxycytidine kinase